MRRCINLISNKLLPTEIALGYLGLIPFLACLTLSFFVRPNVQDINLHIFIGYSAIILSFLAGSYWTYIRSQPHYSSWQLIVSNSLALVAWITILIKSNVTLIILGFGFALLYFLEKNYTKKSFIYQQMRKNLTVTLVIVHILMFISLTWREYGA